MSGTQWGGHVPWPEIGAAITTNIPPLTDAELIAAVNAARAGRQSPVDDVEGWARVFGHVPVSPELTHGELTAWLIAHPKQASQDLATALLAVFRLVRR